MTTDDREADSQNPSTSFKVGEFDRLSGFFTPVWESKRRLRAGSPIPASSAAASAPSSRGAEKPPTPPLPAHAGAPVNMARAAAAAATRAETEAALTPAAATPLEPPHSDSPALLAPATQRDGGSMPLGPASTREAKSSAASEPASVSAALGATPTAPPAAPPSAAAPANEAESRALAPLTAAVAVSMRPMIPMPNTPGRPTLRPKAPQSSPSAGSVASNTAASKQVEQSPRPEHHVEREPEFRGPAAEQPRRGSSSVPYQRPAAAAVREKLERRLPSESVDTFPRHRETESEREALQAAAARAAGTPGDAYPSQVLRTLRRTIHLSTPLPDAVRQMLEKYRY